MAWELVSQKFAAGLATATENFILGLASLIVVLAALVAAWLVGKVLVRVLRAFLESVHLEKELKKRNIQDALWGFSLSTILEKFIKLMTYVVFLGLVADVVHLNFLSQIVGWFIGYIPLLIQGATIVIIALLAANYVTDRIRSSKMPGARILGLVIEAFVLYTAIVLAMPMILPAANVEILQMTFYLIVGGIVLAISLGLAIALGLGLKDTVNDVAKSKKEQIKKFI